jgi:hypothetical protein
MNARLPAKLAMDLLHFLEEFKMREKACLRAGGSFIVPMPHFTLI